MLKTRASDPETMTSCSESLGTLTYSVSPGLASEGLNVMRLTVRSAFMAPSVFSLCEGSRLGGTAMVYIYVYDCVCFCVLKYICIPVYVYIISKGETELRLGQLKGQKDAIQPLDELKQKAAELNEHITEDLRIIEDENTSPSEREAARERLAVRNEELEGLNEEIEARERQRPLLERVKEIFKKYGSTLQAVVLAVGVVLSALALAGLNGIKAGTKAVRQGLETIGQKLGSLLPGLIGSIVSFIFKAAGQVLSFLGEHAWLLILAVVAFFMERLLKKRRKQ